MRILGVVTVIGLLMTLFPPPGHAVLQCDLQTTAGAYYLGDSVDASLFLANSGAPAPVRLFIALILPDGSERTIIDKLINLPPDFRKTFGPRKLFRVKSRFPEGQYSLRVLVSKPTGELVGMDRESFTIVPKAPGMYLDAQLSKIVYDPLSNIAYGLDEVNNRIIVINLTLKKVTGSVDLTYKPADACLSSDGSFLYVVNYGTTWITRAYPGSGMEETAFYWDKLYWAGNDEDFIGYHIYCSADNLFIVDGQWAPTLRSVDLATYTETTTDVTSVGDLVFSQDFSRMYTWYQYGWSAGFAGSDVYRYERAGTTFSETDVSTLGYPTMSRDPLDTPIFYDETRNRVVPKKLVLNYQTLADVLYTFPEEVYAADFKVGNRAATRKGIFSLDTFDRVADLSLPDPDIVFFDNLGTLYLYVAGDSALYYQDFD